MLKSIRTPTWNCNPTFPVTHFLAVDINAEWADSLPLWQLEHCQGDYLPGVWMSVLVSCITSLPFHSKLNHQAWLLHGCAALSMGKYCKILKSKLVHLSWQPSLATLAPWDIFPFPRMKLKLRGCRFKQSVRRICCWFFVALWKENFKHGFSNARIPGLAS
jgi:hypothetical protein